MTPGIHLGVLNTLIYHFGVSQSGDLSYGMLLTREPSFRVSLTPELSSWVPSFTHGLPLGRPPAPRFSSEVPARSARYPGLPRSGPGPAPQPHPISSAPALFMAPRPGPLRPAPPEGHRSSLPVAAARICATAAALSLLPPRQRSLRVPAPPRLRPAHARARSRTGPPGAGPGARRACVHACERDAGLCAGASRTT